MAPGQLVIKQANIAKNISRVYERIHAVCTRVKRNPKEVSLVVATKYVDVTIIQELLGTAPHIILGESRVQDAVIKVRQLRELNLLPPQDVPYYAPSQRSGQEARPSPESGSSSPLVKDHFVPNGPQVHFIGHLQTNKVKAILPHIAMLHSLDRMSLASELEHVCRHKERILPVLLQINISGERSKFGFSPAEVTAALPALAARKHLKVLGLMTMAPYGEKAEVLTSYFSGLRLLGAELATLARASGYDNMQFKEYSMGMSEDFELALAQGATLIRLGRSIFT